VTGLKKREIFNINMRRKPTIHQVLLAAGSILLIAVSGLIGCRGGGGNSGSSAGSTVADDSLLYVSGINNLSSSVLLSYNNANSVTGSMTANRVVAGGSTTLNGPRGMAVDMTRNLIYVANYGNDTILAFNNARSVTGGSAPSRSISQAATLIHPSALFIDAVNDRLYVANTGGNSVLIYDNASTLDGSAVSPNRALSGGSTTLSAPTGLYVDTTRDLVYVANGSNEILVFNNAHAANGGPAPVRTIAGLSSPGGIYVDVMADRLYVANTGTNAVLVFNTASTASGSPAADRTLSGGGSLLNQPRDVFVDTGADRLYVANAGSNAILVFNSASTVTNPAVPDRNMGPSPVATPWGIYVDVTPIVIGSTLALDGYARSDGTVGSSGSPAVGDKDVTYASNVGWRQLYSFDIASIPASATITSATLRLYQCDVAGAPYTHLGNVILDHVNYGAALAASAYSGATVSSDIGTLSTTASLGYRLLDVTTRIQSDMAAARGHSQFRLRFSLLDYFANATDDFVQFTDADDSTCAGTTTNRPPQLGLTLTP
jgi:DNA-binding beta-propeller fold protein YncE